MSDTSILWFRKDLRLDDNPALIEAAKHKKIIPLFIFDRNLEEYNKIGEASHWWLEKSLISLNEDLNQKLNVLEGDSLEIITKIIKEENIKHVYWNRCYEPDRIVTDTFLKKEITKLNVFAKSFNSSLLWEPWKIKNKVEIFIRFLLRFLKRVVLKQINQDCLLINQKNYFS